MCTAGDALPGDAAEALRMLDAALDYINEPLTGELPAAAHGEALLALGRVSAKLTAARARLLPGFDATRATTRTGTAARAPGWRPGAG